MDPTLIEKIGTALVAALATRRLTSLIVDDEITSNVREAIWAKRPPEESKIGYLFTCRKCSSVWAGFAVLLLLRSRLPGRMIADTLALSELSILVDDKQPKSAFFN